MLDRPDYLAAAQRAARFLLTELRRPDGRLLHCWRQGHAKLDAYLDDYAYLINALVTLYETDFAEDWIDEAVRLTEIVSSGISRIRPRRVLSTRRTTRNH